MFVPPKSLNCFGITCCDGFLGPEMSPAGCAGKPGIPDKNELEQRAKASYSRNYGKISR